MRRLPPLATGLLLFLPLSAQAHHEAIFGPQSSLVLSTPAFVSLQAFTRRTGVARASTQENVGLISAGVAPVRSVPLSFTAILPASYISTPGEAGWGVEDAIFGLRYRLDVPALQERFGREGNFLLAMAATEVPTGNVDHPFLDGPLDHMVSLLYSVELGSLSAITYGFFRYDGEVAPRARPGEALFLGAGLAWTPIDAEHRLLSLQLGLSQEIYARDVEAGARQAGTGGWAFMLHPTVAFSPGGDVLLFAMVSLPAAQRFADRADEERFRAGAGVLYAFH